jgi:hypothetical protein
MWSFFILHLLRKARDCCMHVFSSILIHDIIDIEISDIQNTLPVERRQYRILIYPLFVLGNRQLQKRSNKEELSDVSSPWRLKTNLNDVVVVNDCILTSVSGN